jgi:hypothetical protein
MRRLSFFVLLGPGLAFLTLLAFLLPLLLTRPFAGIFEFLVAAFLMFYVVELFPLLAIAGVDELMARKLMNRVVRAGVCGVLGFGGAVAGFYFVTRWGAQSEFAEHAAASGLFGAIPAVVCSWLSNDKRSGTAG